MPNPTPGFDPRFDPRFQPGYDPDVHGESSAPRPSRRHEASTQPSPELPGDIPVLDADDLAPGGAIDREEREVQDAAAPAPRSETALLLRNPFVWLIVVLGAALVVWSWTSYSSAVSATSDIFGGAFGDNEQTQDAYTQAQFALGLAPFGFAVGLLVLMGVVFFAAITWRRERREHR
ncbi:hypothetical protein [Paramicrobacterium agarici]|uniref:Uncharacterized protein n=1 Tax=Paramicrobacterium agarici TaxID=630514 RepID=A0A2A9DSE0_9MICO|nr:hypothetical protein [Microbacterium agarici]PFG29301.1 hypothetical protein ATJ78_0204 [Microbacterium agarici]TQO22304.1 hypothetical protein FB385_1132 [Microbacterium agarici]